MGNENQEKKAPKKEAPKKIEPDKNIIDTLGEGKKEKIKFLEKTKSE